MGNEAEDLIEETDELELEIVDDTPEDDRNRPARADGGKPDIPEDEEIENYSDGVQKRIKKLKYEFHEERRAKEAAERMQQEAVAQAQRSAAEVAQLRNMVSAGENVLHEQAGGRIDAQLESAKAAYKVAYEEGDPDKIVEATGALSSLHAEKARLTGMKPAPRPAAPAAPVAPQAAPQAVPPQPQPNIPRPSKMAVEWAQENEWFQKDNRMTAFAFGVHQDIIQNGVQPDTPEYYRQIDKSMRETFPSHFKSGDEDTGEELRQKETVVAPTSRSSTKRPRKVRLTQTQVTLAKRLGLTNQQYAEQLIKEQANG